MKFYTHNILRIKKILSDQYLYHHSNDVDNGQDAALNLRTILLCTHLKVTYFLLYPLLPSNTNMDDGLNMELFSFIAVKVF